MPMSLMVLDISYRYQKAHLPKKVALSQESQIISEYSILRPFILSIDTKKGDEKDER